MLNMWIRTQLASFLPLSMTFGVIHHDSGGALGPMQAVLDPHASTASTGWTLASASTPRCNDTHDWCKRSFGQCEGEWEGISRWEVGGPGGVSVEKGLVLSSSHMAPIQATWHPWLCAWFGRLDPLPQMADTRPCKRGQSPWLVISGDLPQSW